MPGESTTTDLVQLDEQARAAVERLAESRG